MRILLTGATGFVGNRFSSVLAAAGHQLVVLSRSPEAAAQRLPGVASAHGWDSLQGPPPVEAYAGIDAVIHLAGESVVGRWTQAKRRAIEQSRVLGTRHLVEGLEKSGAQPRVLLAASAVGYYGDRGEEELTEKSPPGNDFLAETCQRWEAAAAAVGKQGVRCVRFRIGIVLAKGGGALQAMLLPFRLGLGGPLGSGAQWWSWIHRDDLIGLMRHFLEEDRDFEGVVNATTPSPERQKDFARKLGKVLRRPAVLPAPAFAMRWVLGGFAAELLSSKKVLPTVAENRGYCFQHSDLDAALQAELAQQ